MKIVLALFALTLLTACGADGPPELRDDRLGGQITGIDVSGNASIGVSGTF